MQISRRFSPATDVVTLSRGGIEEHYITARTTGKDNLAVFRSFPPVKTAPVSQFVFGGCRFHDHAMALMGQVSWPVTWVHGDGCSGEDLSANQAFAVSGAAVKRIELDGRVVGCAYEDDDAEYCHLGGIVPADRSLPRPDQARSVFERLEAAVKLAGMNYGHVVRTWLFLENLLDWYAEFNAVRTRFYDERGLFDTLLPASTGIGAANPTGSALVAGAIALKPRRAGVKVFAVPSPLQCPPTSYRSSFNRAVEVHLPGRRHLYVSGAASISPDGQSAHLGDVDKQIALTMKVIGALLESRGMNWSDVTRVVAYFKSMEDAPRLSAYCRERRFPPLPVAPAHAAVCRHDLLFEAEVDALKIG